MRNRKRKPQYPHGVKKVDGKDVELPSRRGGKSSAPVVSGDWPEFKYHHKRTP